MDSAVALAPGTHVVTGAFGYSGRYLAARLLGAGATVRTLTASPGRQNPFGGRVTAMPFHWDDPARLAASLRGTSVLYNTYWIRFNHRDFGHAEAVRNTTTLFRAAAEAGVGRIVHVSITNPSEDSDLEYFSGKAVLERRLAECGVPHTILRPTVLFGAEDILIHNIAWMLRRFPVFGVFGDGRYRLQPIFVDDLSALAVREGTAQGNHTIEAIGPETFTYRDLVETIAEAIGRRRPIVSVAPGLGLLFARGLGWWLKDVVITRPEIEGLMRGLLYVDAEPAGTTKLSAWVREHAETLGRRYQSELARRRDRSAPYDRVGISARRA